jgi:hypothetical protein
MYLTAQRVVTRMGHGGVNVYEYIHGPVRWAHPLPPAYWPEYNPGYLNRRDERVPPGGNAVISYLDVVAPDEVPPGEKTQWIAAIKDAIPAEPFGQPYEFGPLWVRFGMSRMGIPPQTELGALAAHILLRLFFVPPPPAAPYGPPAYG